MSPTFTSLVRIVVRYGDISSLFSVFALIWVPLSLPTSSFFPLLFLAHPFLFCFFPPPFLTRFLRSYLSSLYPSLLLIPKHLLNVYCVSGTTLGALEATVNKAQGLCPSGPSQQGWRSSKIITQIMNMCNKVRSGIMDQKKMPLSQKISM